MSQRHLIVLDFPGIKQFVFGTDRLVEIRGGSALLDQLNRDVIPAMLQKKFGTARAQCVFAGGGAGQFIINDTSENIRNAFADIQGEIHQKTGGAIRLVTGIVPLENNYAQALARAFLDLKKNKQENPFAPCSQIHTGFIRECESCSGIASALSNYAGDSRYLCETCLSKEKKGQDRGLWKEFSAYLSRYGMDPDESWKWRPEDFEKIGKLCQARSGYTALVYGDGNAMGQLVKKIDTEERFRIFSKTVDKSLRESCYESLYRHCHKVNGKIPADILLLGGDDLIVYLSADMAMQFAIDVAKLFEAKTKEKLLTGKEGIFFKDILGNNGLTISIGIAYGRSHTPISIMVDQAEELLKSAKKKGSSLAGSDTYTPACIDFHLTSRYNQVSVSDSRRQYLEFQTARGEKIRLYQCPYTIEESEDLIRHARQLKESGIPSSRLHRLGDAPFKGKMNGTIETLIQYGRCRDTKQKLAIWNALDRYGCMSVMPWHEGKNETKTVMVDLIEISEFIQLKTEDIQDASSNST